MVRFTIYSSLVFRFEESPCASWTNTDSLERLCTLFVLSALRVFEHIYIHFIEYACSLLHDGNDEALLLRNM